MRYYIAVINDKLHQQEWAILKATLKTAEVAYMVYYSDVKQIELNQVNSRIFYEMVYSEN
jgi:hypothetical protein